MKETEIGERNVETLDREERRRIKQAVMFRFEAYLKPGETISVDAEREDEYVYSQLNVEARDDSFELELEAAVLAADQGMETFESPQRQLDVAFEFLKQKLYEFFQSERREQFHPDWRHYTVEARAVRFRGRLRRPELERRADELLDSSQGE
ncbi:MAG: hypothetical protein ABEL76_05990 [Bradymonadaceae bacterium]